jgi:hypothetical protein
LAQKIADLFPVTCSRTGYKRGNRINILNGLNHEIRVSGTYQDSGKIFESGHGLTYIPARKSTSWEFVKHAGSATGSNGVLIIDLPQKSLVIFYENPWSKWNFAGFCIENKMNEWPTNKEMKQVYKRLYRAHPRWPGNCRLADNVKFKSKSFTRRLELSYAGYKVGAFVQYQLIDKAGPNDCYNQEISVIITRA